MLSKINVSGKLMLTLLVTACCFLITYFYFGFYYAEYEALNDSFYSGKLTEGMPFYSLYFLGNIGVSYLYALLYQANSTVEWISFILYSYLFVSTVIGLYLIYELLPNATHVGVKIAIQISVYLLVFSDQNTHFIYTRVSYMVTGLALIGILYFFRERGSIKERKWLFVFLNVWFVLGVLTRSESATAVVLLLICFGLYYVSDLKRLALLFVFPLIVLSIVLGGIAYALNATTEYYMQVEPEIEAQFCERENIVPISEMKTDVDSAKYLMAKNIIWSDPKVLTPQFMRSLIRNEGGLYTNIRQWKRVYSEVEAIMFRFWHLSFLCLIIGGVIFLMTRPLSRFQFLTWFVFTMSIWLLTALQTYTVKINDRSFSPYISIFVFCNLLVLLPLLQNTSRKKVIPLLLLLLYFFIAHLTYLKEESNQLKSDFNSYKHTVDVISKIAANKYLVVNSSSCDYLFSSNVPFHPFNFSAFKKLYISDGFNMPFLPYYRRYLEKECDCDMADFPSFWEYLKKHKAEVVVVSSKERIAILSNYLKVVHHYDLGLVESDNLSLSNLQKSDSRGNFTHLKLYRWQ